MDQKNNISDTKDIKDINDFLGAFFGNSTISSTIGQSPVSDLQQWINTGKKLLKEEINTTKDEIGVLYEKLLLLNDQIMDEEERLDELINLLNVLSK